MQWENPKTLVVILLAVLLLAGNPISHMPVSQTAEAGRQEAGIAARNATQQAEMYFSAEAARRDIQLASRLSKIVQ